jgi:hypothetical protein
MQRTSLSNIVKSILRTADILDNSGEYRAADSLHVFIKNAQNNINNILGDVPGGFMLHNLNQTAYGLKGGMGGFPGSGHSYWDANGGEKARWVDPRNLMMFQGDMSDEDIQNFYFEQMKRQEQDEAWKAPQRQQLMRDIQTMQQQLKTPGLNPSDKASIEQAIQVYLENLNNLQ